ncbi:protoporphyrinogen/coproporphyrinogen oxidase [Azospirillum endophyticum]
MINDVLVIGGGIAGLSAAATARDCGLNALVLEEEVSPGGLLRSFEVDGFRFDNGVHLSFASEPEVRAVFDQTPWIDHEATSFCRDNGVWLRHPVQNNLYPLSIEEKIALIDGLVHEPRQEINNYREWLVQQYGAPIAERWPIAYTKKYWTIQAEQLGIDWIGQRMRRSDLKEVLRGAFSERAPNTYYINRMRYPEKGGYGAFVSPLVRKVNVKCGKKIIKVDYKNHTVYSAEGEQWSYRHLVSTLPLPELISMMPDVPDVVGSAAKTLFATRVDLISIALNTKISTPSLWFYVYDSDVHAARVYSPSWKSAENAPFGCSSLQFEIYSSSRTPMITSVDQLIENCLHAMEKFGIASRKDVRFTHHKHLPYANVVFDLGMEKRRDLVRNWVENKGISLAGRFGEWAYLWSNQSFMSGRQAILNIVSMG